MSAIQERYEQGTGALHERYPFLGMVRAHHTNNRGQPMDMRDKPYLVPLYMMLPKLREVVICKGVQTGVSEMLIAYILHEAGWRDRICAYVLPQYKTAERFVGDRIDPVIARTPAYAARLPGGLYGMELTSAAQSKGNLKRKRFGKRGSLLFLGSNTPADFLEFSCDVAIVDEYDACDLNNVAKIGDRTKASDNPQIFYVSNPRIPGRGITKMWSQGNRSRWHMQCSRCGERQALDWFRHIVMRTDVGEWVPRDTARADAPGDGDLRPVCQRCRRPFERTAAGACWIAEAPDRDKVTLHNTRLDVLASRRDPQPIRSLYREFLAAQGNTSMLAAWWAAALGLCYEPEGTSVTQDMLDRAAVGLPMDHVGGAAYDNLTVVMGVDVGAVLNVKISVLELTGDDRNPYRRVGRWVGAVPEFSDLISLVDKYRVDVCVIDAMPETRKSKEFRQHYIDTGTCEVWLARYHPTPRVGSEVFGMVMDYSEGVVTTDRTQLLDATLSDLANGRMILPSDVDTVLHFSDQMRAPKRKITESGRAVWDEGNDPDHYRHADAYERIAVEIHDRGARVYL